MAKKYPVRPPAEIGERYQEKCTHCGGTGQEPGLSDLTCRECIGRGRRKWLVEECPDCHGKGKRSFFSLSKCSTCRGRGWIRQDLG
jgi:molecular chaperone DnaJ